MKFRFVPGTNNITYSIEPGDLVALVDARDNERVLSPFYEFPETGLIEIKWEGPQVEVVMAVFGDDLEILCRYPATHSLTLLDGDVLKFHEPGGHADVLL